MSCSSCARLDCKLLNIIIDIYQALSEGDYSGHMAGAPSIWGPQIVFDLTLDIYGISGFLVTTLLKRSEKCPSMPLREGSPNFFFINQSKVVYCSPNLQNEFAVHVQSSDKRGNPKERTVPLAGSPSFTISLRCITNKVVFVNTYLKKQYQNQ